MTSLTLEQMRLSVAELMAAAVKELFPKSKLVGGGAHASGFYYDFVTDQTLDALALSHIEERMRFLVGQNLPIESREMVRGSAAALLRHLGHPLLAEKADAWPDLLVPIFEMGDFRDCLPPPFLPRTGGVGVFKLGSVKKYKQRFRKGKVQEITRIEGTAFQEAKQLKAFIKGEAAMKKGSHLALGESLNLFHLDEKGGWLFTVRGNALRKCLLKLWIDSHPESDYHHLTSPLLIKESSSNQACIPVSNGDVLRTDFVSSHTLHLKKMLAQHHPLPFRLAEQGVVYRPFKPSPYQGLYRTLEETTAVATLLCKEEQVAQEVNSSLQLLLKTINMLPFRCQWHLVTQDKVSQHLPLLENGLKTCQLEYSRRDAENTQRGPSVEARVVDPLLREWVLCSLRFEEALLEGYHLLVRTQFESLERGIACLLEKGAGEFPFWLAPEQVRVLSVKAHNAPYAKEVQRHLLEVGGRVGSDVREAPLGAKVHAALQEKVPYCIIVGDKEEENRSLTIRPNAEDTQTETLPIDAFCERLRDKLKKLG